MCANRSSWLIEQAKEFLKSHLTNVQCVSISGSAARGTADMYSDIDVTVYAPNIPKQADVNTTFRGTIVQVHYEQLPSRRRLYDNPWDYRFLLEMRTIKDEGQRFEQLVTDVLRFFQTPTGKKVVADEVHQIVQDRIHAAHERCQKAQFFSATHAAMGAWCEAAFWRMFVAEHTSATDRLIPFMRKNEQIFAEFKTCSSINESKRIMDFSTIVRDFRAYLRKIDKQSAFDLDPLQDELVANKNRRYIQSGDMFNLQWQMYGEALLLYFSCVNEAFETFYDKLPGDLQRGLGLIGFVPLTKQKIERLCDLSESMI
ncbi:MAG: nucleotidyltransferase domain-containing protein [Sporolactobacillus sp.]